MNRKWFTLVELVVVITIITILSAVSFISYTSYLTTARNSQRTVDLAQLSSALELFYKENKKLPDLDQSSSFKVNNVFEQGIFDNNISFWNVIKKVPVDPKNKEQYYVYSKTIQNQTWNNKEKYQLAATLEFDEPKALVVWNYQPVTYNYPSIILAATKASWINNYFVIDWWKNLAYSLNWDNVLTKEEVSDITKKDLLKHVYKTCEEIKNSWEFIWNLEYQLYNSWRDYTAWNCN